MNREKIKWDLRGNCFKVAGIWNELPEKVVILSFKRPLHNYMIRKG